MDILYKKSYSELHYDLYLRRFGLDEARKVMHEIHNDDCGNHAEERSLVHKFIDQGYYWPKMFLDTKGYVKK